MKDSPSLPPTTVSALIAALRNGRSAAEAADTQRVNLEQVYAAALRDTDLAIALAGRDPYAVVEIGRASRAEVLRLVALGHTPTMADTIVSAGGSSLRRWRREDPLFAEALDVTAEMSDGFRVLRRSAITPEAVVRFLTALRMGQSVVKASAAAGVTYDAMYKRRSRDEVFAEEWDTAVAEGQKKKAQQASQ